MMAAAVMLLPLTQALIKPQALMVHTSHLPSDLLFRTTHITEQNPYTFRTTHTLSVAAVMPPDIGGSALGEAAVDFTTYVFRSI